MLEGSLSPSVRPEFLYKGNMASASLPVEGKKRGRPAGAAFAEPIPVRMTPACVAEVTAYAEREGIKVSEAIRRLVEEALKAKRT
jgi:hypothetical protein